MRTDSASPLQKLAWLARAVFEGVTFSSVKLRAVSRDKVRAALKAIGPFDGYVLNSVQLAGAFEGLFDDKPSIFVAHNVEFRSAEENAAAAHGPLQKYLYRREARLLEGIERRLCDKAALRLHAGRRGPRRTRRRRARQVRGAAAGDAGLRPCRAGKRAHRPMTRR